MKRKHSNGQQPAVPKEQIVMPVCYLDSSGNICWGNAVALEPGKRAVIRFDDGGWNHASDCFFTESQCRRFHRLPPQDWIDQRREIAKTLKELSESFAA